MIVQPSVVWLNPSEDLQNAVDATPTGSTLFLGPGVFAAPAGGLLISKPITLIGYGCGTTNGTVDPNFVTGSYGTIIQPASASDNGIYITSDDVQVKNLSVINPSAPGSDLGTGNAIRIHAATANLTRILIEDVIVWNAGHDGLNITNIGFSVNLLAVVRSQFKHCGRDGVHLENAAFPLLDNVWCAANRLHGLYLYSCGLSRVRACSFEGNQADGTTALQHAQAQAILCHASTFDGCSFETYYDRTVKIGLSLGNCYGCRVEGSFFGNPSVGGISAGVPSLAQLQATLGVVLRGQTQCCHIGANVYDYVNTYVYIHDATLEGGSITNTGNLVHQQVTHNTAAGLDGYSYIPTDTPTYALFPRSFADSGTLGAPQDRPGGIVFPPSADPPASIARRGAVMYEDTTNDLKVFRGDSWSTVVAGAVSYEGDVVTYDDDVVSV